MAVIIPQYRVGNALSECLFVERVDIVPFSKIIVGDKVCTCSHVSGLCLLLAHLCPCCAAFLVFRMEEFREFHYIERKLRIIELLSPVGNHESQQSGVFVSSIYIGFTLIP